MNETTHDPKQEVDGDQYARSGSKFVLACGHVHRGWPYMHRHDDSSGSWIKCPDGCGWQTWTLETA